MHDPKVLGRNDVKAKIDLQFKGHDGKTYVGTRRMELNVKNGKNTFKTVNRQVMGEVLVFYGLLIVGW